VPALGYLALGLIAYLIVFLLTGPIYVVEAAIARFVGGIPTTVTGA
jgi:hypothetical protein